jgi:flagellar hook-basal body complex protein FliE
MSIPAIEPGGFVPFVAPVAAPPGTAPVGTAPVGAAQGLDFTTMLATGIERLEGLHDRADSLAVQAATGDLSQIHDYTITATEAAVSTQLTTAVRNKALEAFQEIMRISI